MGTKSLLKQLATISYRNRLMYNGYNASKIRCSPLVINKVYNFTNHYCSTAIKIPVVSYNEIKQLSKHPEILLIDVREPHELKETGKIPTSINIPLGQLAEELGPNVEKDTFKAKYGRNKPDLDTEIIFHCKIGKRSQSAAELAINLGYKNTKNYLGSWMEWAEKEGYTN